MRGSHPISTDRRPVVNSAFPIGSHHRPLPALALALLALAGCVDEPDLAGATQATQCGPVWDAVGVEAYTGNLGPSVEFVDRHQLHVGYQVEVGCSGTLVSDDLFLSAGHCAWAVGQHVRFDYQNRADGTARPTRDFTVSAVVEQQDDASFDYAIVRLDGEPGRWYGHATVAAVDPPVGTTVTIIGHPALQPKAIHAGPVLDYSSGEGTNWFRYQVDTLGGNSGSGVLDPQGRLVGLHTNAGCNQTGSINGNSGMRMSQLIPHSQTLVQLSRTRLLWWNQGAQAISLWNLDASGDMRDYAEHAVDAGWTPISLAGNVILWRHDDGRVSYWRMRTDGSLAGYTEHGPYGGWTALAANDRRILWRHTSGAVSLWSVNGRGEYLSHVEHVPAPGWTAIGYANDTLLLRHTNGRIALWTLDDSGALLDTDEYGPFTGWTALSYGDGELIWRHVDGRMSTWTIDRAGSLRTWTEHGPFTPWTLAGGADHKRIWRLPDGRVSYWTTDDEGGYLTHVEHGPFAGWTALYTASIAP